MPQPNKVRPRVGPIEHNEESDRSYHETLDKGVYEDTDTTRVISCRNSDWVDSSNDLHSYRSDESEDWQNQYLHEFGLPESSATLLEDF